MVIPARDAATTIARQITAVAAQLGGRGTEIVVVDNRSSDATASVATTLGAKVVSARDHASPGYARNVGARASTGALLLFCDADDEVCDGWVQAHLEALARFDIAVGSAAGVTAARPLVSVHNFAPGGGAGNLSVRREVFEALRGFDVTLQAGEDLDLCWRGHAAGFSVGHCPDAEVRVSSRGTMRQALRQGFRNGRADVDLFRRHRSSGMRRRRGRRVLRSYLWLGRHAVDLRRPEGRIAWGFHLGGQLGRLAGSARRRTLYL